MNCFGKVLFNTNIIRHLSSNFVSKNNEMKHYDCLGITLNASQSDVKEAYYKLSKQHHPDTNSGNASAVEKFRDIAEAYEILGNVKSRRLYDSGIVMRNDSKSEEQLEEDYKYAPFYNQRNDPLGTKSTVVGKACHYNMDEWTSAHYKETFTTALSQKQEGQSFLRDKTQTLNENKNLAQIMGVIVLLMTLGFEHGTDASR